MNPCGGVLAAFNVQASRLRPYEGWGGRAKCRQERRRCGAAPPCLPRPLHPSNHPSPSPPLPFPPSPGQGASWSTPRRGFHFHNSNPPAVTASVGPADVPGLVPLQSGDGGGAADGVNGGGVSSGGSGESRNAASGAGGKVFAVYIDSRQVRRRCCEGGRRGKHACKLLYGAASWSPF